MEKGKIREVGRVCLLTVLVLFSESLLLLGDPLFGFFGFLLGVTLSSSRSTLSPGEVSEEGVWSLSRFTMTDE